MSLFYGQLRLSGFHGNGFLTGLTLEKMLWYRGCWFLPIACHSKVPTMSQQNDLKTILNKLHYSDDAKVVEQISAQTKLVMARMKGIRRKVVVMSGKGGVGKSMTTVNLALAFARMGQRVGLLDVDINGPCVPQMLGMRGKGLLDTPEGAVPPTGPLNIKVASMDFLLQENAPVRWKGPMDLSPVWLGMTEMNVIREFLSDMVWGELDYLLADLPPGAAADKPPLLAGLIPDLAGAVVVTTPSEVASNVVQKSIAYAQELGIEILGVVENMSQYRCPSCGEESPLFEGDTDSMCEALGLPLLGRIPFDRNFARTFDKGEPVLDGDNPTAAKYQDIAKKVHTLLDYQHVLDGKV